MYDTKNTTVSATKATRVYQTLLALYPHDYQKRFGQEMSIVFHDLYQEELAKNGKVGVGFWLSLSMDTLSSAAKQHMALMQQQGIKNYFHLSAYNSIGALLLLPFLTLLGLDLLGRLVQGDLTHYNRAWYQAITHSALYREPLLLQLVFVYGPMLAVILNLIPLAASFRTTKKRTLGRLFFANPLGVIVMGVGFLCLFIVYGHDFAPCMVHGMFSHGFSSFSKLIAVCGNA